MTLSNGDSSIYEFQRVEQVAVDGGNVALSGLEDSGPRLMVLGSLMIIVRRV